MKAARRLMKSVKEEAHEGSKSFINKSLIPCLPSIGYLILKMFTISEPPLVVY